MNPEDANKIWSNLSWWHDLDQFPEIPDKMERLCVILRMEGRSYQYIQKCLGNPSKKWIRKVLLKWAPDTIENCPKPNIW